MAEKEKSIIDEALLDAKRIQETLNANTKEILRSIAKEEIDDLVKESLNEFEEEDVDDELTTVDTGDVEELPVDADSEEVEDIDGDVAGDDISGSEEGDLETGDELSMDDEIESYGDEMDMTDASDDEVIAVYKKLTGDDEIQIVSNDNGDIELTVNEPGEFVIKADGAGELEGDVDVAEIPVDAEADAAAMDADMEEVPSDVEVGVAEIPVGDEDETYEEGYDVNESQVVYEIAIDEMENIDGVSAPEDKETSGDNLEGGFDDDGQNGSGYKADTIMEDENVVEGEEVTEGETEVNEEEISEEDVAEGDAIEEKIGVGIGQSVGNHRNPSGPGSIGAPENPSSTNEYVSKADYDKLLAEAKALKTKASEMAGTLQEQRKMLGKVVVFNTNLTNVTRLFTEHSTTKEEKKSIIERFDDEVSNIQESKRLFKAIEKELANKKPISESVEEKISKEKSSSSSKLNESTAYVDQGTKRIMDLISRVENPDKY